MPRAKTGRIQFRCELRAGDAGVPRGGGKLAFVTVLTRLVRTSNTHGVNYCLGEHF